MNQTEFLTTLLQDNKEAIIIGSLGTISYDLDQIEHPNKICIRGNMGGAMGVALGYALNTDKKVICLTGDGAFLMQMGSIATILKYFPLNLEVYILNNGVHKSTGGQPTNFNEVVYLVENLPRNLKIININEISINTEESIPKSNTQTSRTNIEGSAIITKYN